MGIALIKVLQGKKLTPEILERFSDRLLSTFTKRELSIDNWDPFSESNQNLKVSYCFQLLAVLSLMSPPPLAGYRS